MSKSNYPVNGVDTYKYYQRRNQESRERLRENARNKRYS